MKKKKNRKIHQTPKQIYYTGNARSTAYTKETAPEIETFVKSIDLNMIDETID